MAITKFRMTIGPEGPEYSPVDPDQEDIHDIAPDTSEFTVTLDDNKLAGVTIRKGIVSSYYAVEAPFAGVNYPIGTNVLAMKSPDPQLNNFIDYICEQVREAPFAETP